MVVKPPYVRNYTSNNLHRVRDFSSRGVASVFTRQGQDVSPTPLLSLAQLNQVWALQACLPPAKNGFHGSFDIAAWFPASPLLCTQPPHHSGLLIGTAASRSRGLLGSSLTHLSRSVVVDLTGSLFVLNSRSGLGGARRVPDRESNGETPT